MENQVKIMVVDDEIGICRNVEKILSKNDYAVVHTQSAAQALEMMKDGSFSLLISDIVMPEMNGLELLNHVAKEVPDIKTVMMTGYASTDTAVKAIRLGALDYIPKPFTPDELRTTVNKALLGEFDEIEISDEERDTIEIMDIDIDFGDDVAASLAKSSETSGLFDYDEIAAVTGPEYVKHMNRDGFSFMPYEELKKVPVNLNPKIGIDQPFNYDEVAAVTGAEYVQHVDRDGFASLSYEELKKTTPAIETQFHCSVGDMVCDVMEKLGTTCKTGVKKNYCPKLKAREKKQAKAQAKNAVSFNPKAMIGIDQPFDYDEVMAVTGPEYVQYANRDGFAFLPYKELKKVDPRNVQASLRQILVVDDEVAVNNNIRKILAKTGFGVDQAVTKVEALEKIKQHSYKLVLLDLRIPGVSGLELLSAIAEKQPDARVIIITGYASIETAINTARIGAVDYLPKPFTPDELRHVTQRAYALAA